MFGVVREGRGGKQLGGESLPMYDSDGSSQSDTFDLASMEMLKLLTEHQAPMDDDFLAEVRAVRERYF